MTRPASAVTRPPAGVSMTTGTRGKTTTGPPVMRFSRRQQACDTGARNVPMRSEPEEKTSRDGESTSIGAVVVARFMARRGPAGAGSGIGDGEGFNLIGACETVRLWCPQWLREPGI